MWSRAPTVVGGVLLIGVGVLLLAVNSFGLQLPFDFGRIGWPVFVIAPGVVLLIVGLVASGEPGVGLAVAGGIVTTVGSILAYQSATDHWSSWAYAWSLIAPTSVGASMLLWGSFHGSGSVVRQGLSGLGVGIVVFIVGFAFFEGVLNLGGTRGLAPLGRQALPIALIGAGVLVIISRLWPRPSTAAPVFGGWAMPAQPQQPPSGSAPPPGPTQPAPPWTPASGMTSPTTDSPSDTTTTTENR
jgi:hypothetical protein